MGNIRELRDGRDSPNLFECRDDKMMKRAFAPSLVVFILSAVLYVLAPVLVSGGTESTFMSSILLLGTLTPVSIYFLLVQFGDQLGWGPLSNGPLGLLGMFVVVSTLVSFGRLLMLIHT